MAFHPTPRQLSWIKAAVFVLALLPFARLVVLTAMGVPVNPLEFITRGTGDWTLYFLCITLGVTPLRKLSKWNWLIKLRRMIGLYAFFYAAMHFLAFFWFDHFFDLQEMWKDVLKRPFITVGFIGFVLLIPLAVTSTNAMVRRLGGKQWQWLHRLVYVIAPIGILHFWWMKAGKHDFSQPIICGLIVAALLGIRLYWKAQKSKSGSSLPFGHELSRRGN